MVRYSAGSGAGAGVLLVGDVRDRHQPAAELMVAATPKRAADRCSKRRFDTSLFPELPSGTAYTYHYLSSFLTPARVSFPWIMVKTLRDFRFESVLDFRPEALPLTYFDPAHRVFGRLSRKDISRSAPTQFPGTLGQRVNTLDPLNLVFAHSWIARPTILNEFRFGWARQQSLFTFGLNGQPFDGPGLLRSAGVQGVRSDPPKGSQVPDIQINGIDMIRWNDEGLITDFKVMIRPLKAIQLVQANMAEALARRG